MKRSETTFSRAMFPTVRLQQSNLYVYISVYDYFAKMPHLKNRASTALVVGAGEEEEEDGAGSAAAATTAGRQRRSRPKRRGPAGEPLVWREDGGEEGSEEA